MIRIFITFPVHPLHSMDRLVLLLLSKLGRAMLVTFREQITHSPIPTSNLKLNYVMSCCVTSSCHLMPCCPDMWLSHVIIHHFIMYCDHVMVYHEMKIVSCYCHVMSTLCHVILGYYVVSYCRDMLSQVMLCCYVMVKIWSCYCHVMQLSCHHDMLSHVMSCYVAKNVTKKHLTHVTHLTHVKIFRHLNYWFPA